jgi:hypothetical protein
MERNSIQQWKEQAGINDMNNLFYKSKVQVHSVGLQECRALY